jgi:hypothetical protein
VTCKGGDSTQRPHQHITNRVLCGSHRSGKQAYVAGTSGRDRDMGQVEDTLSGETHANTRSDQHHEAPSTKLAVQRHWHGRYKHTVHLHTVAEGRRHALRRCGIPSNNHYVLQLNSVAEIIDCLSYPIIEVGGWSMRGLWMAVDPVLLIFTHPGP